MGNGKNVINSSISDSSYNRAHEHFHTPKLEFFYSVKHLKGDPVIHNMSDRDLEQNIKDTCNKRHMHQTVTNHNSICLPLMRGL